jgi:hypothetical protein
MNYAVVILAFVFLFATVLWFAWGRKVFTGPISAITGVDTFVEKSFQQHSEHAETGNV